jgi:hypothetical protein
MRPNDPRQQSAKSLHPDPASKIDGEHARLRSENVGCGSALEVPRPQGFVHLKLLLDLT